ncbi:type IV secretory system conjugative DNA transfer family protein [Mycoplasma sp. 3686d]|uniref:type IV secretory system conjugative DNA transfer family protein n=1 Tax=Mycoplasma sp. 3686d TaxID=2967300 RepID=UPI00211BB72E|nr:type IV secretory system conjugative DNA transfer family protein [Mycoplasma sp. 3686d]UUM24646.1 type IV secretory system conjugative DNA transfer family protein [Mycoplasma sp. 3686d]
MKKFKFLSKKEFKKGVFFGFLCLIGIYIVLLFLYTLAIFIFQHKINLKLSVGQNVNEYFALMWELFKAHGHLLLAISIVIQLILDIFILVKKKDKKYEKEFENQNVWLYDAIKNKGSYREYKKLYGLKNDAPAWVIAYEKVKGKLNWYGVNLKDNPLNFKILGGTRSGKTQKFVIPILKYNINLKDINVRPNLVVADPKGELNSNVKQDLKDNGYREIILDISNPLSSIGFNMLNMVWDTFHSKSGNYLSNQGNALKMLNEIIASLKEWNTRGESSSWDDAAKQILYAIGKYLLYFSVYRPDKFKRHNFNLATFSQFLNTTMFSPTSKWKQFFENLNNIDMDDSSFDLKKDALNELKTLYRDDLKAKFELAEQTLTGQLSNAILAVSMYSSNLELKSFTCRNDLDVREIIRLSDPLYKNSKHYYEQIQTFEQEITKNQNAIIQTLNMFKNELDFIEITNLQKEHLDFKNKLLATRNQWITNEIKSLENKGIVDHFKNSIEDKINELIAKEKSQSDWTVDKLLHLVNEYLSFNKMISYYQSKIELYKEQAKPFALFIKFPDHEKSKNLMVNIIIEQIYKNAIEIAQSNGGELNRFVLNIFDEFGNLPVLNDFGSKLSIALSRKVMFLIILQSYAQLEKYGRDNKNIILENTGLSAFISSDNEETVKEIASALGKVQVERFSYSENADNKNSKSISLAERELMNTSQIKQLDKKTHLIFRLQNLPLKLKSTLAFNVWKTQNIEQEEKQVFEFDEKEYIVDFEEIFKNDSKENLDNFLNNNPHVKYTGDDQLPEPSELSLEERKKIQQNTYKKVHKRVEQITKVLKSKQTIEKQITKVLKNLETYREQLEVETMPDVVDTIKQRILNYEGELEELRENLNQLNEAQALIK